MNKLIILFLIVPILYGCGSSARFSSSKSGDKEVKEKKGEEVETIAPLRSHDDEYKDYPVLETETGVSSYYSKPFDGKKTASGEIYDQNKLTAAHINYPFNTIIRVINLKNNKSVVVRVNDRRPSYNGRLCDISKKAAEELDMIKSGLAKVKIEVLQWGEKKGKK